MGPLIIWLTVVTTIFSYTNAHFECIGTCYSGQLAPKPSETFHGLHLKGFSYKNITTDDPRKCYSSCAQDCRCKACQMKDSRCELLDKDKNSRSDRFEAELGYVYYELQQTMSPRKSHMLASEMCFNGCCQSQPCMNDGTCIEHCETPKIKFSCKCKPPFFGTVCDTTYHSCLDVLRDLSAETMPVNGFYPVTRLDTGQERLFYCAFNSSKQAWTLLESFSRSTTVFNAVVFGQTHKGFYSNPINWKTYRLSSNDIHYVRKNATVFLATCNFPQRVANYTERDFLFGTLNQLDIVSEATLEGQCTTMTRANIRGYSYHNRQFPIWQKVDSSHLHTDTSDTKCGHGGVPNAVKSEDAFGLYEYYNTDFSCTATADSTTQWWLGQELLT